MLVFERKNVFLLFLRLIQALSLKLHGEEAGTQAR
jgi:hypothetical protein